MEDCMQMEDLLVAPDMVIELTCPLDVIKQRKDLTEVYERDDELLQNAATNFATLKTKYNIKWLRLDTSRPIDQVQNLMELASRRIIRACAEKPLRTLQEAKN